MPDGTPGQQAESDMGQWIDQRRPVPTIPGPFGGMAQIGATVRNLVAAAGAGQIAVAPDTGQAVIDQLTKVQDEVDKITAQVQRAAVDPRFGGGYAEQVSQFVQRVAAGEAGSAEEILAKYREELEQLKDAVAKSIGAYQATDASAARAITNAGGQR